MRSTSCTRRRPRCIKAPPVPKGGALDITQLPSLNPRRHRPFRILPRHKGGGLVPPPLAVSPLIELELRGKNERVARRETKRLIYKLKVLGQPVTSEVRSSAEIDENP